MSDVANEVVVSFPWAADAWEAEGLRLSNTMRSVMWDVGDWWNDPPDGVNRVKVVRSDRWKEAGGLTHGVCRVAGSVANRWPVLCRHNTLTFEHHKAVAPLPDEQAIPLLEVAANQDLSVSELRALVKRDKAEPDTEASGGDEAALYGWKDADGVNQQWPLIEDMARANPSLAAFLLQVTMSVLAGHADPDYQEMAEWALEECARYVEEKPHLYRAGGIDNQLGFDARVRLMAGSSAA